MTRIDTQQLDRQIKQIMTEIIPVLREHMDNVCSSQLLEYIQQRVIEVSVCDWKSKTLLWKSKTKSDWSHRGLSGIHDILYHLTQGEFIVTGVFAVES